MVKKKLAVLSLLACSGAFAQSASDQFLDVTTYQQVAAANSAQASLTGVAGIFNPATLCPIGQAFCSGATGTPTAGNGWYMKLWRLPVAGRQAIVIRFDAPVAAPYRRSTYSAEWIVRQNNQYFFNTKFYGGGGAASDYAELFYRSNDTTAYGARNTGATNIFILTQDPNNGPQYDPSKAFELLYVGYWIPGNDYANAPIAVAMPAAPAIAANFSPSDLNQGQNYTLATNTVGAPSLSMNCTGALGASEALPAGSYSVTRTATELGQTTCKFSALGAGGFTEVTATRVVREPGRVPPPNNPCATNPRVCARVQPGAGDR